MNSAEDPEFASVRLREGSKDGPVLAVKYPYREPPMARWALTAHGKMRGLVVHWDGSLAVPARGAECAIVTDGPKGPRPAETETAVVQFAGIDYPEG